MMHGSSFCKIKDCHWRPLEVATTYRRTTADKISRRNSPTQSKSRIKSAEGETATASWRECSLELGLSRLFIRRKQNQYRLFMPDILKCTPHVAGGAQPTWSCEMAPRTLHGYRDTKIVRPRPWSRDPQTRWVAVRVRGPCGG